MRNFVRRAFERSLETFSDVYYLLHAVDQRSGNNSVRVGKLEDRVANLERHQPRGECAWCGKATSSPEVYWCCEDHQLAYQSRQGT